MTHASLTRTADPRWKDLYRLGAISFLAVAVLVTLAIIAYFIWPYRAAGSTAAELLTLLQEERVGTLIAMDISMIIIVPLTVVPTLALYVVLKEVNPSYALIALALSLIAVSSLITARPLVEMARLSDQYAAATTEAERAQYVAAAESLRQLFDGTAWAMQTLLLLTGGVINSVLMLRSPVFTKATAYVGLAVSVIGLGFFIPVVGIPLLFLNTIGAVVWYVMLARPYLRLGWGGNTDPH